MPAGHNARPLASAMLIVGLALAFVGCDPPGSPDSGHTTTEPATEWPGWGGAGADFRAPVHGITDTWEPDGPIQLWSRSLGAGYSGIVVSGHVLYTMYRDGGDDVVIAMRADDGSTIWEHRYDGPTRPDNVTQFGEGPNATPFLAGGRLFTLGYAGKLHALDAGSGEVLWVVDLIEELGGDVLEFGYSASPMVFDDKLVVLVGGDRQAVIALDPTDGSAIWSSAPGSVSYATPTMIDVEGHRQLVYFSVDEVIGLDLDSGRRLWSHPCANQYSNHAAGMTWRDGNILWVSTQLDGGTRALRLAREGEEVAVEELWFNGKISVHFWNSLHQDSHVYASIGSGILAGIDAATGEIVWREPGFKQANFIDLGDRALVLDADGMLSLARLSPNGIDLLAQARIVDGTTWTAPTVVGTRMYLRDRESIRAVELGEEHYEAADPSDPASRKLE